MACFVCIAEEVSPAGLHQSPRQQQQSVQTSRTSHSQRSTNNTGYVNINMSSSGVLETLPGVGETIAQDIIDACPFHDMADLQRVFGIGDHKYAALECLVCV